MAAQKIHATTQKFTEIVDFADDIVISSYIHELEDVITKTKNPQLAAYVEYYAAFVKEMVTVNVVLNKSFYIVVPFSSLEMGVTGAANQVQTKKQSQKDSFIESARKILQNKSNSLLGQLQKFATSARTLEKEDLIKLFYEIYNED